MIIIIIICFPELLQRILGYNIILHAHTHNNIK